VADAQKSSKINFHKKSIGFLVYVKSVKILSLTHKNKRKFVQKEAWLILTNQFESSWLQILKSGNFPDSKIN